MLLLLLLLHRDEHTCEPRGKAAPTVKSRAPGRARHHCHRHGHGHRHQQHRHRHQQHCHRQRHFHHMSIKVHIITRHINICKCPALG